MKTYTIADLSREFGITYRAIRFYEEKGFLAPQRDGSLYIGKVGRRIFSERDRAKLAALVKGKALGFTLRELEEMVHSGGDLALSRDQIDRQVFHLERQLASIELALSDLRKQAREAA